MSIKILYKQGDKWLDFDINSIIHMPVRHALHLFSNEKIQVIASENGEYFVNTEVLAAQYRKKGKTVTMFKNLLKSQSNIDRPLSSAGFTFK